MATGHPQHASAQLLSGGAINASACDEPEATALDQWCATLQRACRLEAERGFPDLKGSTATFSVFIHRNLTHPLSGLQPGESQLLADLAEGFATYAGAEQGKRQQLVQRLRQLLHQLRRDRLKPLPAAPPKLRLQPRADLQESPPSGPWLDPQTPLAQVKGINARLASRLAALNLWVVGDLVHHYPRDYLDYSQLMRIADLAGGHTATIVAKVRRCHAFTSPRNPNLAILELHLEDITGRLKVSRFFAGRRFASPAWCRAQQRQFPAGSTVAVSGLVKDSPWGPCFSEPLLEVMASAGSAVSSPQIGRLVPVYGLTEGLTAERLRTAIETVLPSVARWGEPLPQGVREQLRLPQRAFALRRIHKPENREELQESRRRLVFDELLLLQLALARRRQRWQLRPAPPLVFGVAGDGLVQRFLEILPFALTAAQRRVLAEIRQDLERTRPMARLVQGDVGSGKTVVAVAALLGAIEAGHQGALMAPTEVLASQHFHKLAQWLPRLHVSTALLTGATPARLRRQLLQDLANGQLQLLVGTHALLEDPVHFDRLGLVVVDEQHRFGVRQRNRLLAKGLQPHLLTMTATPIPRTLALAVHGDLDVSQIDELPPGRTPVRTRLLGRSERQQAWDLIREQVALGQRAYVVLPLVEDSEKLALASATEVHRLLAENVFPELEVGLLHGRLASETKQAVISAFATGGCQVLVSTTVVEVGVDVPEASVMVIEHAERFGLAQLHQLRGRVGRGAAVSHCLLLHDGDNAMARARLEVLTACNDGFEIAELDLRLRGPGQVLGTQQSGLPDLALAGLREDGELLEEARRVARDLITEDPGLVRFPLLRKALEDQRQRWQEAGRLN